MNVDLLLTLLITALSRAGEITALIDRARKEGRDVTDAELDALVADDNQARADLQAAIDRARP
jgi:RNA:NAD 2'-phosphotransferase (TPT1/KptA family)